MNDEEKIKLFNDVFSPKKMKKYYFYTIIHMIKSRIISNGKIEEK